jgi:uncharacterized radical SAM superfamily Fe-S cluster-containing enzyme
MSELTVAPKRRLSLAQVEGPAARRARLSAELASLELADAERRFSVQPGESALKTTLSLCAECLRAVPALVFTRAGSVLIRKSCEQHGVAEALLERDESFYFLSSKDQAGRAYRTDRVFRIPEYDAVGSGCCEGGACEGTDQSGNKTCTVLVEVTNACNLSCRVCYSDSKGDRVLPLATFCSYIDRLAQAQGGLDSVQVTGGEAMLHPEFWQMVEFLHHHARVKKIYLPTNGLLLAKPGVAEKLRPFREKVMVLLQFDGVSDQADQTLRAAKPAPARRRALERLAELGIHVQLTMTLARNVNEAQIGDVVELALAFDNIKVVALQPVTSSGRHDIELDPMDRLTLSDVAKAVAAQIRKKMRLRDFAPIPCSHPNCGWITLFVRRFGRAHNIMRFVDLERILAQVAYKTLLSTGELREAVGTGGGFVERVLGWLGRRLVRSTDVFTIAIKPFMDRFTYDQDRIANCCHHLLDTNGNPISFCEYNALLRQGDSWARFPQLTG